MLCDQDTGIPLKLTAVVQSETPAQRLLSAIRSFSFLAAGNGDIAGSNARKSKPMTIRNLDRLFAPRTLAVIGASRRAGNVEQPYAESDAVLRSIGMVVSGLVRCYDLKLAGIGAKIS